MSLFLPGRSALGLGTEVTPVDFPYPSFPFTTLSLMTSSSISTGFSKTVANVAVTDSPYGINTAVQYTARTDGGATTVSGAALSTGVDVTGNGNCGTIRMTYKPITNFQINNTKMAVSELRLYSTGTPSSPGTDYHLYNLKGKIEWLSTSVNSTTPGRWQSVGMPVSKFTVVGAGANLASIKYAMLNMSGAGVVLQLGNIDFVPNPRTKAALIFRIDDASPSAWSKAYPALSAFPNPGVLYPGAVATAGFDIFGKMTSAQLQTMIAAGWQLGSQSYSTELNTIVDSWDSATRNKEYVNTRKNAKKYDRYRDTFDGTYYSNVVYTDMIAYPELSANFRTLVAFLNGNPTNPPFLQGETFPFSDPHLIKAINLAQDGGSGGVNTTTYLQYLINDAVTNKGVVIAAMHDDWGTNSFVEQACNDAIAYVNANPTLIEITTPRALLAPYNGDNMQR